MKNVVIYPNDFSEMQKRNYLIREKDNELIIRNPNGRQLVKISYDENNDKLSYKLRKMKGLFKIYVISYPHGIIINGFYIFDKELYEKSRKKFITKKGE